MCATPGEIERGVAAFARSSNGGLILTGGNRAILDRDLIVTLAAQHKLPAIYANRFFVAAGGLISLGPIGSTSIGAPLAFDRIGNGEKETSHEPPRSVENDPIRHRSSLSV